MTRRVFSLDDQRLFARLSGDRNPLHVDPVVARRHIFGSTVVHGIHSLLWGLDAHLASAQASRSLRAVRATFPRPVLVGEEAECLVASQGEAVEIEVSCRGQRCARVVVEFSGSVRVAEPEKSLPERLEVEPSCRDRAFDEISQAEGRIPLFLDPGVCREAFPSLYRWLPSLQTAELLATTRLIGMECPGLHSLYSELDLSFGEEVAGGLELSYRVRRADRRFSRVPLEIAAPGMSGRLVAFYRPRPVEQPNATTISEFVGAEEFRGQRVLVVGGSRGLGEVTAKIAGMGGADVRITYCRGREDAERVVSEITAARGKGKPVELDVLAPHSPIAAVLGEDWVPSHLYYFATPRIEPTPKNEFSELLFRKMCLYYVSGFFRLVSSVRSLGSEPLTIYYPSTVFLDENPLEFAEYVTAKAAGEALCTHLSRFLKNTVVHCPRLPRMQTDQTISLLPVASENAFEVILSSMRSLCGASTQD